MNSIVQMLLIFWAGAAVGSFLNVYVLRSLDGRNWITGRSECDSCGHPLSWYELIPVFSYLAQGGKCRSCKTRISPIHFYSEIAVGFIFLANWTNPLLLILMVTLWINVMSDLQKQVTFTGSIYVGTSLIFVLSHFSHAYLFFIGFVFLLILNRFPKIEDEMGFGDFDVIWLLLVYGGVRWTAVALAFGCGFGFILCSVYCLIRKKNIREFGVPMVPFIFTGVLLATVFGGSLC